MTPAPASYIRKAGGAGGIGFLVNETMRGAQYPKAVLAILLIVLVVNLIDFLWAVVRRGLV